MDAQKHNGSSSSSSSFTSDLFGDKESSGSSVFSSIFSQSPKGWKRDYVCSEVDGKRNDSSSSQAWTSKPEAAQVGGGHHGGDGKNPGVTGKETTNFYQEQRVQQPCHLSSSIYYGGQDIFTHPQSTQSSGYTTFNNDVGEDDSGSASRGNWWQGSLYY